MPWSKVRNDIAAIVPVPKDKRSIFVVPWGDFTYIGTTDTDYDGPLDDPECTPEDVDYLLNAMNLVHDRAADQGRHRRHLGRAAAADRGRQRRARRPPTCPACTRCSPRPAGSSRVTGGKLTTYRRMAADTVDAVVEHARARRQVRRPSSSASSARPVAGLRHGAGLRASDEHLAEPLRQPRARAPRPRARRPDLARPLVPGLPYRRSEAIYAVRHEMATTLDDVLSRRTRARLLGRDATAGRGGAGRASSSRRSSAGTRPAIAAEVAHVPGRARRTSATVGRAAGARARRIDRRLTDSGRTHPADRARDARRRRSRGRLTPTRVELDDALPPPARRRVRDRARRRRVRRRGEPRLVAAHDGLVARRPGRGARGGGRPTGDRGRGRRGARAVQRGAGPGDRGRPGAAACAARACRCTAASCSTSPGSAGSSTSTPSRWCSTCSRARSAPGSRTRCAPSTASTLGHWPQSIDLSTVGGWLACRGAGQMSTRYGKIEDMVVGLDVVLADGREIHTGGWPRAAVGPDLTQLFVGSEGTLGIITGARLRLHPAPPVRAARRVRVRRLRRRARRVPAHPAPRRDARGDPPLRRDRGRPLVPDRPDRHVLLVMDEGDPLDRRRDDGGRRRGVRDAPRALDAGARRALARSTATTSARSRR